MGIEIEHKYLVTDDSYKDMATKSVHIRQGYLSRIPERTVRIRIADNKAWITIKGRNEGDVRLEMEYDIPYEDACKLIEICQPPVIEKIRYFVNYAGMVWEIDEFLSLPHSLTLAEIELPSSDYPYELPQFIGKNVTHDPKYYNSNIGK